MNNKYKVLHMEDFFTVVHEVIVCLPAEIKQKADEYYESNLLHETSIVGVNWNKVEE